MTYTVNAAFNQFHDKIKLNKSDSERAIISRDNLLKNINNFKNNDFPSLYSKKHNKFGSFARKTKINPLDDIDLLVCINAQGSTYHTYSPDNIYITPSKQAETLQKLSDENKLNSIKVIEKFKSNLKDVSHYKNAEINRRKEAVTLSLESYKWTFDIVPCFFTAPNNEGKTYYVIPDGKGNWKFSDPRIDQDRIKNINQTNNGKILMIIRILKYLAIKYNLFKDNSYLLEVLILNYYERQHYEDPISKEIFRVLNHIMYQVQFTINDPQNIRDNINTLSINEINQIRKKFAVCSELMIKAIQYEKNGEIENAINLWRVIIGSKFPQYG